jgi:hypothetical protein
MFVSMGADFTEKTYDAFDKSVSPSTSSIIKMTRPGVSAKPPHTGDIYADDGTGQERIARALMRKFQSGDWDPFKKTKS